MKTKYMVVGSNDLERLEKDVERQCDKFGYTVQGGVSAVFVPDFDNHENDRLMFYQALIQKETHAMLCCPGAS